MTRVIMGQGYIRIAVVVKSSNLFKNTSGTVIKVILTNSSGVCLSVDGDVDDDDEDVGDDVSDEEIYSRELIDGNIYVLECVKNVRWSTHLPISSSGKHYILHCTKHLICRTSVLLHVRSPQESLICGCILIWLRRMFFCVIVLFLVFYNVSLFKSCITISYLWKEVILDIYLCLSVSIGSVDALWHCVFNDHDTSRGVSCNLSMRRVAGAFSPRTFANICVLQLMFVLLCLYMIVFCNISYCCPFFVQYIGFGLVMQVYSLWSLLMRWQQL